MRAAYDPVEAESNFYSALRANFFSKDGLAVDATALKNGAANAAGLLAGSIDVAGVNISSLLAAHQRHIPFTILALGEMYTAVTPTAQFLVPSDSPVTSPRELSGKTVAVNIINGLGHLAARAWIDQSGGDSTSVRYVEMPFDAMPPALAARRVDGASIVEPQLSIAKRESRVLGDHYSAISRQFLISAWVATQDWVAKNPDAARRFNLAMREASIWANRNRDRSAEIASGMMHADVGAIRAMTRATYPERQSGLALVQPVVDAAARYHIISGAVAAADLFNEIVRPT
jgi:ABC-type nitrate/sulfonate/bicarbonate transport system substrate-binding protein